MSERTLSHVGIAVTNLQEAMAEYRRLGFRVGEPEAQPDQGVTVAFVELANTRLELLEPLGPKSPIQGFLEKRGPGIHHIAIGVGDIVTELKTLADAAVPLLDKAPRPGAHHHDVAFLHPKATSSRVLLELCQKK